MTTFASEAGVSQAVPTHTADSRPSYANDEAFEAVAKYAGTFENPTDVAFGMARLVYRLGHPEWNTFPENHLAHPKKDFQGEPFLNEAYVYKDFSPSEILFAASQHMERRVLAEGSTNPLADAAIGAFANYYLQKTEQPNVAANYAKYQDYGHALGYTEQQITTNTGAPETPHHIRMPDDRTTATFMSAVRLGIE